MGVHITYRKDFDENGNEIMIEVSREEFEDPIEENLEEKANRLMSELSLILNQIKEKKKNETNED